MAQPRCCRGIADGPRISGWVPSADNVIGNRQRSCTRIAAGGINNTTGMTKIWMKYKEDAENTAKLRMIAVAKKFSPEEYGAIVEGRYQVVPNTDDDRGGYLVILDE